MSSVRIQTGSMEPIEALILDATREPLPSKSDIFVSIRRKFDELTLDWDDMTFKTYGSCTTPQAQMTAIDNTNYPGQYARDFDTSTIVNKAADDTYEVTVDQTPGIDAVNVPQIGEIKEGQWADQTGDLHIAIETTVQAGSTATEVRTALTQADDFFNNMIMVVKEPGGTAIARNVDVYRQTNGAFTTFRPLPFTPTVGQKVFILNRTGSLRDDNSPVTW